MRIIIEAEPKDIAALVVGLQGQQIDQWSIENLGERTQSKTSTTHNTATIRRSDSTK